MKKVCMFWIVNSELWIKTEELNLSKRGNIHTYSQAHLAKWESWCKEHNFETDKGYMYYPRGRVSYNKDSESWELLLDACLLEAKYTKEILNICGITSSDKLIINTETADQKLHYVCHKCNRYVAKSGGFDYMPEILEKGVIATPPPRKLSIQEKLRHILGE